MIKIIGITLTIAGIFGLTFGVLGIFGNNLIGLEPWALAILGLIFFTSGIGLLKKSDNSNKIT